MKATNLTIGQKYTWRRNSSTIIEVTYLGIDPHTHNFRGHEFSYEKPEGAMYMTLSEMQIDSDIKEVQKPNEMEKIMVNVWGQQTEVYLTTWEQIKKLGFKKRDRAFGSLNDGTPALFFGKWDQDREYAWYTWYLTIEKLENIED